ncbi:MAG TPA: PEGA domain-containing protein [Polyangiaceae bacterium]|nr:PEGA domain-containing protein [Polyangiaceae bacterium]
MKRGLAGWLLLAALGASGAAFAQQPADIERAKASFRAGANAYAAGDYPAAIQALEVAYELTPLPAIAFSLAQAERKQYGAKHEREHAERALRLYQRYLEQEPNGARRNDAQLAIAELEPQLATRPAPGVAAPPKLQARPTRLMVVSDAPGARISLDGGASAASPLIREVTPGRHRAHVTANGYRDADRDVVAVSGELIMSEVRLSEQPTSLYVWAPLGADIYVDGVYVAEGGPLATVPLASGDHQLVVAQTGRQLVRRDIKLEHGHTHTEYVTLEPTQQRSISELLFIGGGVGLGAGIILSAFAARSQNKAEKFIMLRNQQHHATGPELLSYNAAIVERDRYRTGAVIGFAGAAGLFITGLFLHELDSPSLPAQRRQLNRTDASRTTPRVAFSPVTATGNLGAALELHF